MFRHNLAMAGTSRHYTQIRRRSEPHLAIRGPEWAISRPNWEGRQLRREPTNDIELQQRHGRPDQVHLAQRQAGSGNAGGLWPPPLMALLTAVCMLAP